MEFASELLVVEALELLVLLVVLLLVVLLTVTLTVVEAKSMEMPDRILVELSWYWQGQWFEQSSASPKLATLSMP